jgi:CCR4-NOT transcription complex subunit 2
MSPNPPAATPTSAPSASSASEVGFDPNEFPALGSLGQTNNSNPSSNNNPSALASAALTSSANNSSGSSATSYAIQAGQGGSTAAVTGPQSRDFGPEDFPALGGHQGQQALPSQSQPQSQNQPQSSENHSPAHPPGLNGFNDHRPSILGSLNGAQQPNSNNLSSSALAGTQQSGTPGMLNLRGIHPGFQPQSDAEKQRVSGLFPDFRACIMHHFARVSVTNILTKSLAKLRLEAQPGVSCGMECS